MEIVNLSGRIFELAGSSLIITIEKCTTRDDCRDDDQINEILDQYNIQAYGGYSYMEFSASLYTSPPLIRT